MTIAAGFLHRDGVLLCADTEHGSPAMKFYDTKLDPFEWRSRAGAFAYSGNSKFAVAAIQKCKTELGMTASRDPIRVIEDVLGEEYRRVVFSNPGSAQDEDLHFSLLVAIPSITGSVELYASHETSIRRIDAFECTGIGNLFAGHLVRKSFIPTYTEFMALCIAAHMLALVKEHVPGCGGPSQFISVRHDGTAKRFDGHPCVGQLETWSDDQRFLSTELLFQHMDMHMADSDFELSLENFTSKMRNMRQNWKFKYGRAPSPNSPRGQ